MSCSASPDKTRYFIGDVPVIEAMFVTAAGVPTNPTTQTFMLVDPAGTQTTIVSPNAAIVASSGFVTYTHATALSVAGMWGWRAKGVGGATGLTAASEGTFEVLPSLVLTP